MTRRLKAPRRRRENQGRHYHPRNRQGETAGRQVLAVGRPGRERQASALDLKAGDRVLFGKCPLRVKVDGEDCLL